jgi:CRP/FNR family transcriptional regulator, cyclic AMP receptor protein
MVGMTRESINKQLRVWAGRNWVRLEHGAIVVLNAEPLRALAEAGSDHEGG